MASYQAAGVQACRGETGTGVPAPNASPPVDLRFRTLIGEEAWGELPPAVCARFSKFIGPETRIVYSGNVVETDLSRLGWLLAVLAHVIGSPLPRTNGATGEAVVAVASDGRGGQSWRRTYTDPVRGRQTITSAKRFRGPTGLEEYVGGGIGMALRLSVENGALVFRSDHYFLEVGPLRLKLPGFLAPGRMEICHRDEGNGRFSFSLELRHPWVGRLLYQLAVFADSEPS